MNLLFAAGRAVRPLASIVEIGGPGGTPGLAFELEKLTLGTTGPSP
jgi:hypothetical protein